MDPETTITEVHKPKAAQGGGDAVYGIGMIGAWVYYIGRAKTVKEGVLGFLKGFAWPAIVVYEVLKLLNQEEPE